MKTSKVYATLAVCLSGTSIAYGQTPPAQQHIAGSHNIAQATPEQKATQEQAEALDRAAAKALHVGHYIQAEADARQALALTGGFDLLGPDLLAAALDAQGKMQAALQAYKVIVVDEGDAAPRTLLPYALLLLKAGQWAQAVAAYDKALPHLAFGELVRANSDFSPDTPEPAALATAIHIARGLTYNAEADWAREPQDKEALSEYQKALTLEPNSDLANYYYGYGLKKLGRTTQASAAFQKTIKIAHGGVKLAAEQALKKMKKAA